MKEGDVVILAVDDRHRLDWPMARVMQLMYDAQGVVRTVRILCEGEVYTRPIKRLVPLETSSVIDPPGGPLRGCQEDSLSFNDDVPPASLPGTPSVLPDVGPWDEPAQLSNQTEDYSSPSPEPPIQDSPVQSCTGSEMHVLNSVNEVSSEPLIRPSRSSAIRAKEMWQGLIKRDLL